MVAMLANRTNALNEEVREQLGLPNTRGTVVERRSLAGELSLSCARPAADGWLCVNQPGQLSLSSLQGR